MPTIEDTSNDEDSQSVCNDSAREGDKESNTDSSDSHSGEDDGVLEQ